jgi:leucyl aminopeptidase
VSQTIKEVKMFEFTHKNTLQLEKLTGTIIYLTTDTLGDMQKYESVVKLCEATEFKFDAEKTISSYAPYGLDAEKIIIASLGCGSVRAKNENTGGHVFDSLYRGHKNDISLIVDDCVTDTALADFLMGSHLKCYSFDKYRTNLDEKDSVSLDSVSVYHKNPDAISDIYNTILPLIDGIFIARDLVSEPANILNPVTYADRCLELKKFGLEVSVLGEQEMADLGMYCLLGVGQGSVIDSKLVVMKWHGNKQNSDFPVSFVGKGVCFDTGGISLKPPAGMWDMVFDMGGSAAVVGAMVALAGRKANANVVGIIGLVENMPDGNAQRPGDVVKTANGLTVEVLNTDAEGRLVLADALWYAQNFFKPQVIIDLATLTGAIIAALGYDYAGLFTNDTQLQTTLEQAADNTGEKIWTMPLDESMKKRLKSRIADLANIASSPEAGSSVAACFLQQFINDGVKWAHLDIAGTAWLKEAKPTNPKGATGWGVRILNEYVKSLEV